MLVKRFGDEATIQLDSSNITFNILHGSTFSTTLTANTTLHITDHILLVTPKQFHERYPGYNQLMFADVGEGWPIDILIGNDYAFRLLTCQHKIEVENLQLVHSIFGYLISGYISDSTQSSAPVFFSTAAAFDQITSLDIIGIKDAYQTNSDEEAVAL